jgi:hypothetical protein
MGTLIYKDDFGNQHILKENVEKDVAAVRTTHKKDIMAVLAEKGYAGTEEEADALLNDGLKETLECPDSAIQDIDYAVGAADALGKITYADEVKRLLRKNGCELLSCDNCGRCNYSICMYYGEEAGDDAIDCNHYENTERLYLGKAGTETVMETPFVRVYDSEPVDEEEIVRVAEKCGAVSRITKDFLKTVRENGSRVIVMIVQGGSYKRVRHK